MIILTIVKFILVVVAIIGFILTVLGTPVGLVLLGVYVFNKTKRSPKFIKWIKISLSGIPILIIVFIVWAIMTFVATFFGLKTTEILNESSVMMLK